MKGEKGGRNRPDGGKLQARLTPYFTDGGHHGVRYGEPMAQDTRKDKRATLDSLVVRYKSATVDEFIENHSHDVSAGGLFVQTEAPFTAGTLLKFEIRIGDDQSVIVGVGRVVWKRDTVTPDGRPPGMGVKFIKIDDPSKTLIRNLVEKNTGAGVEYQAGLPAGAAGNVPGGVASPAVPVSPVAPVAPVAPDPTVLPAAAAPLEAQPAVAVTSAKQAAVPAARSTFASRKSTMLGIGAVSAEAVAAATAEKAAGASDAAKKPERPQGLSFAVPASEGFQEHEPTVMKQAAELLAEALREAGGSMEEVGQNPLFSGAASRREATPATASAEAPVEAPTASTAPATEAELPATRRVADVLGETMLDSDAGPGSGASVSANVSSSAKTEPIEAVSAVAAPVNETKPMVVAPVAAVAAAAADSSRPKREPFKTKVSAASPVAPAEPAPKDTTSRNMLVAAALVVLIGGGAFAAWKAGLMPGGEATTEPTPAPMPSVVTILPPASVLAPLASVTASAEPETAASAPLDAGTAAADAATAAPVESAAAPVVAPKAPTKPYVPPKPKPKPVDPEEPGPKDPAGTSGGTSGGTEPSGGGSTSGAVPAPTPTPTPTPKPVPEKPVEPELQ